MMVDGCFYSTRKGGLVRKKNEIAFEWVEGARRRPGIFDPYCLLRARRALDGDACRRRAGVVL